MTAKMFGASHPFFHRFVLGDFELTSILDGAVTMDISPPFLLDETDDQIAEIARSARLPTNKLENNFVPVVINTGEDLVLIDTGLGALGRGNGSGQLRDRLSEAKYSPEDIDIVMITHVHPDHIGGLWEDGERAFPNAQLMIGRREFEAWNAGDGIPPQREKNREIFMNLIAPLESDFRFLEDGDEITTGVVAQAAFGHSPGHMMVRVKSSGHEVLIWSDVANHYVFSVGHPDSKVGFDDDKEAAIATRNRVLAEAADSGVLVIGHHMPFPGIGYVERAETGFRWVPASYQLRL